VWVMLQSQAPPAVGSLSTTLCALPRPFIVKGLA
jgi:hypothetical protein